MMNPIRWLDSFLFMHTEGPGVYLFLWIVIMLGALLGAIVGVSYLVEMFNG